MAKLPCACTVDASILLVQVSWLIKDPSQCAFKCLLPPSSFNPLRLLKKLGFAGGSFDFVIRWSSVTWHSYLMTSTAFFNSPRGR